MFGAKTLSSLGIAISILAALEAQAQDLSVPGTWREYSNKKSLDERISIAQKGIDRIVRELDRDKGEFSGIGFWQSGNVYTAMVHQDVYAKSQKNKDTVVAMLNKAYERHPHYDEFGYDHHFPFNRGDGIYYFAGYYNDDALWWAQSAMHAYNAYGKDQGLLNHVVDTWNFVSQYVITADHVKDKKHPLKDFTLFDKCEDTTVSSMEGGVFWRPVKEDQGVNSITTGLFLTISAYLAEATKDNKYKDAAIRSAKWIQRLNLKNKIVLDSVNAHDCKRSPDSWLFTYNSGKYLEGLSVLHDITGDASWGTLLVDIAAAAMKFKGWQDDNGVIKEGASPKENNDGVGFKAVFIRGLTEVHERTKNTNSALQILIHSYVCVQYNALLELATTGNGEYSSAWLGPPQGYTTWGQLAALDTLVGAVPTTT